MLVIILGIGFCLGDSFLLFQEVIMFKGNMNSCQMVLQWELSLPQSLWNYFGDWFFLEICVSFVFLIILWVSKVTIEVPVTFDNNYVGGNKNSTHHAKGYDKQTKTRKSTTIGTNKEVGKSNALWNFLLCLWLLHTIEKWVMSQYKV